jgi:homogentisate phytyltransferase/homogentisate geranylgeranyltransferase
LQLYDVEIDRINKPYLPLAAGDFSSATGWAIVCATGAVSLAIGAASASQPLLATLGGSLLLGIVYSTDLPLLRWKRSPVLAAACILAVRYALLLRMHLCMCVRLSHCVAIKSFHVIICDLSVYRLRLCINEGAYH